MNKFFIAIIAIIVIGILLVAIMFGIIPGLELFGAEEMDYSTELYDFTCDYSERDIYTAVCGIAGNSFDYAEFQGYSDSLEFKLCGLDGYSSPWVVRDFKEDYADQGMTLELEQAVGSSGWSGTLCLWSHQGLVYGMLAGEGSAVSTVFNKDVMYITGKGTMMEWQQFLVWATSR